MRASAAPLTNMLSAMQLPSLAKSLHSSASLQVCLKLLCYDYCRDVKGGKAGPSSAQPARRRRRRQQICSLRNLLVLIALIGTLGTMLFLYSKMQPTAP